MNITLNGRFLIRLLSFVAYAVCPVTAESAGPAEAEETPEESVNWIELGAGAFDVSDDDAAFRQRWGNHGDFYGGIDSFRFGQTGDSGTFLAEGHALFGMEDHKVVLGYTIDDVGYLRGGYRGYRTWHDSSGGYLPDVETGWRALDDDALELDRGELWFEGGLRIPDIPEITLGYSRQWRDGQKDSTIWGDVYPAGLRRGIMPAIIDIDETRDLVTLDIAHTLGNTDLAMQARYEGVRNDDIRGTVRGNAADTAYNALTQREVYESDLFGGHITSESRFNDRMMLTFGYAVTTMDTRVDGGQRGSTALATGVFTPTYNLLTGSGDYVQNTMNLNFWWNPVDDLVIVPSIRAGWEEIEVHSIRYNTVAETDSGTPSAVRTHSDDPRDLNEALEVRYNGIPDLVLYVRGEWEQGETDRWLRNPVNNDFRHTDTDVDDVKHTIGANWYPIRKVSLSAQFYNRRLDEDYNHGITGNTFDAQLKGCATETNDFNARLTWRALPNLTLTSRYDHQQTDITNQAFTDALAAVATRTVGSADIESHVFSQSATWNATDRLYIQGSLHWISSGTTTPADDAQPGYHANWDNDYLSVALSAGYIIGRNTDLKVSYDYFEADNHVDNAALTVPYGILSEEHAFTVTMTRWITPRMAWNLRYGFYKGEDDAYGGHNDYQAHMVSTGLHVRF
jgi:hypothetical protein